VSSAGAAVPFVDIGAPSGPLTRVAVGTDLSCQAQHTGDTRLEFFPSSVTPGDCGTFLAVGGVLFTPDFANHDASVASFGSAATPFTGGGQSARTGAGTNSNPFKVVTNANAGSTGLSLAQTDSYISGQESYRTDVKVTNGGGSPQAITLYRAGDCYLQESDTGFGFVDAGASAVGCSINANNAPAGRIEQWYPITGGNQYMEARYTEVWEHIATHTPFPNTTRASESLDNGAGISWSVTLAPGASKTFSHYTTFSPTGNAGPPPLPPPPTAVAPPAGAFGPNGLLDAPPRNKCVSRRYFRIRVRKKFRPILAAVTIKMPKTTRVLRGPPWGTIVDLRGLPKGRFAVKITALTTTGKTIKGTRNYRTCRGKLKGGKPPL
jgi:hypothetical protein